MKKDLKGLAITAMALGTAYGLGILSCVYWELKLFADICESTKSEDYRGVHCTRRGHYYETNQNNN